MLIGSIVLAVFITAIGIIAFVPPGKNEKTAANLAIRQQFVKRESPYRTRPSDFPEPEVKIPPYPKREEKKEKAVERPRVANVETSSQQFKWKLDCCGGNIDYWKGPQHTWDCPNNRWNRR